LTPTSRLTGRPGLAFSLSTPSKITSFPRKRIHRTDHGSPLPRFRGGQASRGRQRRYSFPRVGRRPVETPQLLNSSTSCPCVLFSQTFSLCSPRFWCSADRRVCGPRPVPTNMEKPQTAEPAVCLIRLGDFLYFPFVFIDILALFPAILV